MQGWFRVFIVIGLVLYCGGCRQPKKKYRFATSTPDVWAHEPQQKLEFTVEWSQ